MGLGWVSENISAIKIGSPALFNCPLPAILSVTERIYIITNIHWTRRLHVEKDIRESGKWFKLGFSNFDAVNVPVVTQYRENLKFVWRKSGLPLRAAVQHFFKMCIAEFLKESYSNTRVPLQMSEEKLYEQRKCRLK